MDDLIVNFDAENTEAFYTAPTEAQVSVKSNSPEDVDFDAIWQK